MLVISKSNERKHLPVGDVVLTKGKNKVEDEVMEQNLQNPLIQQAVENGVLIIPDTEPQDTEPQQEEETEDTDVDVNEETRFIRNEPLTEDVGLRTPQPSNSRKRPGTSFQDIFESIPTIDDQAKWL